MHRTTIVIPNYNGIKYMDACLHSLTRQTAEAVICVVDNGSTDGSKELVRQKYPQAMLLEFAENQGFCKAVNTGIRKAETEFVLLLNNDTEAAADFVEQMEAAMDRYPKAFSASARMIDMQSPGLLDGAGDLYCALGWAFARGKGCSQEAFRQEKKVFSSCAGAAIYRTKLFDKIGFFDENHFAYLEDMDIGYRARIYGFTNIYAAKAAVKHAGSGFSGSRHNEFKISLSSRNSVYLIYKNMPALQMLLNLPFFLAGFGVKALYFRRKGFGKIYLRGLRDGFRLCRSPQGKKEKLKFQIKNFPNYITIQWELWLNIIRRVWHKIA